MHLAWPYPESVPEALLFYATFKMSKAKATSQPSRAGLFTDAASVVHLQLRYADLILGCIRAFIFEFDMLGRSFSGPLP